MSGIVVAVTSAMVATGTRQPTIIRKGEAWDADDPIVTANPTLFSSDPTRARVSGSRPSPVVEQSTRAPGERSRARRSGQ